MQREWKRLKLKVSKEQALSNLKYAELYERLFDQYCENVKGERDWYDQILEDDGDCNPGN